MKRNDQQPGSDSSPRRRVKTRLVLAAITLGVLSVITGIISYEHALAVVRLAGNTGLVAYLVPLVPDLTIVGASQVLFAASAAEEGARPVMAWVALTVGIGWTIAMNVAAGVGHGAGAATIAGLIPVAFVLTFESLQWLFRRGRPAAAESWEPPGNQAGLSPREWLDDWIRDLSSSHSEHQVSAALGISRTRIRAALSLPEPELAAAALNGASA